MPDRHAVTIQRVPPGRTFVQVPPPAPPLRWLAIGPDEKPALDLSHVQIDLFPVEPLEGIRGWAGWALVGQSLLGFVMDGPDASWIERWLTVRLVLALAYLEDGKVEVVKQMQAQDVREGMERLREVPGWMFLRWKEAREHLES